MFNLKGTYSMDKKVRVIDSVMGSGKTSYIIDYLKNNNTSQVLYVTPLITECERVSNATGYIYHIDAELRKAYRGKVNATKVLLEAGESVAITHSAFMLFSEEIVKMIEGLGISLIIDETVGSLTPINLSSVEVKILRESNSIIETQCDNGAKLVKWNDESELNDTRILELYKKFFDGNKEVYMTDENKVVIWSLPSGIYHAAKDVTLLTYNFRGTEMEAYFRFHRVDYSVYRIENGNLLEGDPLICGKDFKDLIKIVDHNVNRVGRKHGNSKREPLTKYWYLHASKEQIDKVKNNTYNFFQNLTGYGSKYNMWTVFESAEMTNYVEDAYGGRWDKISVTEDGAEARKKKNLKQKIERAPFKSVGRVPKDLSTDSTEYKQKMCWVPCNSRGTNMYSDRKAVAYLNCMNISPSLVSFFDAFDIEIDNTTFALNVMLQWIWRSAIRNGEQIDLYIPSKRMRHILMDWLGYSEDEKF